MNLLVNECFPKFYIQLNWATYGGLFGEEAGDMSATWSTAFDTSYFPKSVSAIFGKVPAYNDSDTVRSAHIDEDQCTYDARFSGSTKGGIDDEYLNGEVNDAWINGPIQDIWYMTEVDAVGTQLCDSLALLGPIEFAWIPGSYGGGRCERDPTTLSADPGYMYGAYSASGALATGVVNTWDFTCHYTPEPDFTQARDVAGIMTLKENSCPRVRKGKGWGELKQTMRTRLHTFYDWLENVGGCYRFNSGYRSQEEQDKLYNDWHAIADRKGPNDNRTAAQITAALEKAKFAQPFLGWRADGTAKGGPGKKSRHTSRKAADIRVGFRPAGIKPFQLSKQLSKIFNPVVRFYARRADLCGPPTSDLVHVEMKYKKGKQTVARCHFG